MQTDENVQDQTQTDGAQTEASTEQAVEAKAENTELGLGGAEPEGETDAEIVDAEAGAETSGEEGEAEPEDGESDEAPAAPDSPDGYELKVPEDLEWPGGMKIEIDMESDEAKELRQIAFDQGMTQEGMDRLLEAHMKSMATGYEEISKLLTTNREAEIAKIGSEKIAQVDNQLRAVLGKEAASKLFPVLSTAASYEAISDLLDKVNSGESSRRKPGGAKEDVSESLVGRALLDHTFSEGSST